MRFPELLVPLLGFHIVQATDNFAFRVGNFARFWINSILFLSASMVSLFDAMESPLLPGEAVKAAAEVVIRDGIATATNWFTGRANTPPEHDRQLGEMYEAHGFYRPAPSHATFLALVDQALRHAGEIRARHWANFHRLSDERLDGDEVVVVAHANGLATFAERWHTYILPIRDDACSVQGVSYGHRNQRFDFDIENGKIVRATRYTLKPALL